MATERQINANRQNSKLSSGPRSLQGMARSRANSRKHGLTTPVTDTSEGWSDIDAVQQLLLLDGISHLSSDILMAFAEHHVDLHRIRLAQYSLIPQELVTACDYDQAVRKALKLDRYARAAFKKRSIAIKENGGSE